MQRAERVILMKCLILAAGYATRLYPLTENFPKPLLRVGKKTILDWLVDDIAATGKADGFIVISNHRFAHHFEAWAKTKALPIAIVDDGTSTNETRLGAVRDLQLALERTGMYDDALVIAGDNVLSFSFASFLAYAELKNTSCVMTYRESELAKQQRTAIITFDGNGLIDSYEEKPKQPKSDNAVPPFYFYKAQDLARISEALEAGCNADAPGSFAAWLSRQAPVHAFPMPGKRYDIGNHESYRLAQEEYRGIAQNR